MDPQKKEVLLEQCDAMDLRLEVMSAHIECSSLKRALTLATKLREEVSFLRKNIESEPLTFKPDDQGRARLSQRAASPM